MRIGRPAPSFALPDQTGTVRTLDELRAGRRAALFFYLNSATPVCVAEVGRFRDAAGEFDRLGVARIGVSMDTAARSAALAAAVSPDFRCSRTSTAGSPRPTACGAAATRYCRSSARRS
ncbi:redoxin domain-containing protein [Tsukamurella soli]|uniref:redoxin domain-containing protein n=1 Tax=Tsukamurella soli TaxID=644556 RepID=UPI00361924F9